LLRDVEPRRADGRPDGRVHGRVVVLLRARGRTPAVGLCCRCLRVARVLYEGVRGVLCCRAGTRCAGERPSDANERWSVTEPARWSVEPRGTRRVRYGCACSSRAAQLVELSVLQLADVG